MDSEYKIFFADDNGGTYRLINSGSIYKLRHDARGNIILCKGSGSTFIYDYTAYGENLLSGGGVNPFRYAGYYYDSGTGLYYLHNRYYNPKTTRFLTEDPYWNTSNMFGIYENDVRERSVKNRFRR